MVNVPTPIQTLVSEEAEKRGIHLMMKRDDLIHPAIMGNKWRKLKYNLEEAKRNKAETLITFGGAYSNHIAATAAAAKEFGFKSIGIIRGDELNSDSNLTLSEASKNGMKLIFESRIAFRNIKNDFSELQKKYPNSYLLPEGGTNELAIKGASEIIGEIDQEYDYLLVPIGTGGTMAGLLQSIGENKILIGVSSLKGSFIHKEFKELIKNNGIGKTNYTIFDQYHFGGYGKVTDPLISFINEFKASQGIPLDPIYTGKMMFAVTEMMKNDFFPDNSKIIALHTGGLQGIAGFNADRGVLIR